MVIIDQKFSKRGIIVSRNQNQSPNSQRSLQTISVVLYPERVLNSNRYSAKNSRFDSPVECFSQGDTQNNAVSKSKKTHQNDSNPLKNKFLVKNVESTNEQIQEGSNSSEPPPKHLIKNMEVIDYHQKEEGQPRTSRNPKKKYNFDRKINSDSDEISSLDELNQDINNPHKLTEEDYNIIAEQEEYRAKISNSKTPLASSRFRHIKRMIPNNRQRPISASVNTYMVKNRFASRPMSGARAIQHRPSKKVRSKTTKSTIQLEAKSIKCMSKEDHHHQSSQMMISKAMERVITQQQMNEDYLTNKVGAGYMRNRDFFKYSKKNQLRTVGGFVNISPTSRFTLRKKVNPSTTGSESHLLTKQSSKDLQDVMIDGESMANAPLKSMNLVFQSNQSPSTAKSMMENNPVIKMNSNSYRKETSGYLAGPHSYKKFNAT